MKKELLVPLDGTPEAEAVLPAARLLAGALPADLALVSVLEGPEAPPRRQAYLEEKRRELSDETRRVSAHLRTGAAAREILDLAAGPGVEAVVMTTHGRRGLERLKLGSVAEEVLRRAPVPLLVARPGAASLEGKRFVVALDGSPAAERVLPDALRLARAFGRPLDLVRVALPIPVAGGLGEPLVPLPVDDPSPYLQALASRLDADGVEIRTVGLEGRAAPQLLAHAQSESAALLFLTTHGRTGLGRLLMGSIAEEVLRTAPCPAWVRRTASAG